MKQRILAVMLFVAVSAVSPVALAGGAVAGATEITQIMNNAQLAAQYAEQAQQTVTQVKQYQAMLQNLKQLASSESLDQQARSMWKDQNMTHVMKNLQKVVIGGQQQAYTSANAESNFQRLNKGYGNYPFEHNYGTAYKDWSNNTLNSVQNSLATVTTQSENFTSEEGMVQELQRRSSTAQGQLEATQAAGDIGVAMVGQMQKLRQLQMAQMQAQNAYLQGKQGKADINDQAVESVFGRLNSRRLAP
jgi:P-type conjugative transfer protein TrbJ